MFKFILILNTLLDIAAGQVAMPDCNIKAAGYKLVRSVLPAHKKWHPATDDLAGTDSYGTKGDDAWTIPWSSTTFTKYLFSTVDHNYWMVSTPDFLSKPNFSNAD